SDALCMGITLGSLSTRTKQLSSTSNTSVITIQTKRTSTGSSGQSSGGDADVKEMRRSRSAGDGGQCKVELLRHRRAIQCPWNALAVFLFYKWHVLKVPPPDFSNPEWVHEPLFQDGAALSDVHLLNFCGEHYRGYQSEFEQGKQAYKSMSQRTYAAVETSLNSSPMLKGAVSLSRTLHATQRMLQNGLHDEMLASIAGFSTDPRAQPYHISRQNNHVLFADFEETIFPFADYLPAFSETSQNGIEFNQRQTIVGFCNVLKLLRTTLIQDTALLLYAPLYRQMLMHSSVFGSPIFLSDSFRDKADALGEALMTSDCMPMYGSMPKDIRLGKVRPALVSGATHRLSSPRFDGHASSNRLSHQRQGSGVAGALSDMASSVADQSVLDVSSDNNSSRRLSLLQQLNKLVVANSHEQASSAAPNATAETDKEASLRRMSRLREIKERLVDVPDSKRRRVEEASPSPAKLGDFLVRMPPMSPSQSSPRASMRSQTALPSPSASIYLIEDEDGNFVDMPAADSAPARPLSFSQDIADATTTPFDRPHELQGCLPVTNDPVNSVDWESTLF
ncbi:hypothetical protein GGI21_003831, partial [Coemansia aciculifera]